MTLTIRPRTTWGAKAATRTTRMPWGKVVDAALHWPGAEKTAPTTDAEVGARLRQYQAFHQNSRGWSDIAYNHAVDTRGNAYELRGFDRQDGSISGRGGRVYSVLYLDGTGTEVTPAAQRTILALVAEADRRAGHRLARIGHRDRSSTDCPGKGAYKWVRAGFPTPNTTLKQEDIMATLDDVKTAVDTAFDRFLDRRITVSGDDPDRSWETTIRGSLALAAETGKVSMPGIGPMRTDDAITHLATKTDIAIELLLKITDLLADLIAPDNTPDTPDGTPPHAA
ncbi:MAG: hypothetical protein QM708_11995 [Propioniciclava sp.]|uniref:hypothetical protein n=1 Tax=Propioniciclava sp. TaxID=2038686 RepID=UPI0039E5A309